jgi:hypothetical protein
LSKGRHLFAVGAAEQQISFGNNGNQEGSYPEMKPNGGEPPQGLEKKKR